MNAKLNKSIPSFFTRSCTRSYTRTIGLMIVMLAFSACQKNDANNTTPVNGGGRAGSSSIPAGVNANVSLNGKIGTDDQFQDHFEDAVRDFMAAKVARANVGNVDALGRANSGIFFGGAIALTSGTLRTATGTAQIASASRIFIAVNDVDGSGAAISPELPIIYMTNATGTVQGNYADFTVTDYSGGRSLHFVGNFNAQTFSGTVSYDVSTTVDGSTPHAGSLGQFTVPTCSFFNCN